MSKRRKPVHKMDKGERGGLSATVAVAATLEKVGHGHCRYCFEPIGPKALVCRHCGCDQRPWVQRLGNTTLVASILISAFMLLMSCLQLKASAEKDLAATEALKQAKDALSIAQKTKSELDEAHRTLVGLAKTTAAATLNLAQNPGRFGSLFEVRQQTRDSILRVLDEMGVPGAEQEKILEDIGWHRFVEFDYMIGATGGSNVPDGLPAEKWRLWEELRERPLDRLAEPNEIAAFFKECGLLSEERKEWIEDYRYYRKNRQHRRPAVFREGWTQ
jgi:hypothetical protein